MQTTTSQCFKNYGIIRFGLMCKQKSHMAHYVCLNNRSAPWSARGPPRIVEYQEVCLVQVHGLEARHYLGSCAEAVLPTFHALCKASIRLNRHVSTIGDKRTEIYCVKLKAYQVHFIAHCMACLVMHACDHVSK